MGWGQRAEVNSLPGRFTKVFDHEEMQVATAWWLSRNNVRLSLSFATLRLFEKR
jgi:hypothetical protein